MTRIVIIGASVSGHNTAVALRERDKECAITLVTEEPYPFYDRRKLSDYLSGAISENGLFLCGEDFYRDKNITFLKEKKASAVNPKRRLVYFRDKSTLEYDALVVASGRVAEMPDITGAKKEGVFALNSLDDFKKAMSSFITDQVCLMGSDDIALQLARALIRRYKVEVKLASREDFESSLVPEGAEVIREALEEIIGEGGTQAVKLRSGKVIAASAVFCSDRTKVSADFLKENNPEISQDALMVDAGMRTNIEGIFACGSVCAPRTEPKKIKNWDDCIKEANLLADTLVMLAGSQKSSIQSA